MHNTALLLIDFQKGFTQEVYFGGHRNNRDAEEKARQLLDLFRDRDWPVIHTRHDSTFANSPLRPGQEGNEFHPRLQPLPNELVVPKTVNSGFIGTNLKEWLDRKGIRRLIIGGLITNHCVSTTARMAANYGYEVVIVSDATATFDRKGVNGETFKAELVHQVSLASLQEEFGSVLTTKAVIELINQPETNPYKK